MDVIFSAEARVEVREAARFYEDEVEGLGRVFLQKLREGVSEVKRVPFASRIIRGDFRRHLLSRFPYGIIFRIDKDVIFIAAVMHLKRQPGYWDRHVTYLRSPESK